MGDKILLPYYGNAEDVDRIAQYLRTKPTGAGETDVRKTLGDKFVDPRKFDFYDMVGLFTRTSGLFRLTRTGIDYVSGDQAKKQEIIRSAVRAFKPYDSLIELAYHQSLDVLDADRAKHEWADRHTDLLDLANVYRLTAAPMTFFAVCEMAGLGKFLIGRRGAKSRIEFDRSALQSYLDCSLPSDPGSTESASAEMVAGPPNARQETISPTIAKTLPESRPNEFVISIPLFGKTAKLIWDSPALSATEWHKFKKIGDAMFMEDE